MELLTKINNGVRIKQNVLLTIDMGSPALKVHVKDFSIHKPKSFSQKIIYIHSIFELDWGKDASLLSYKLQYIESSDFVKKSQKAINV